MPIQLLHLHQLPFMISNTKANWWLYYHINSFRGEAGGLNKDFKSPTIDRMIHT